MSKVFWIREGERDEILDVLPIDNLDSEEFNKSWVHVIDYESYDKLQKALSIAKEALEKIEDPRKRDHQEPDKYTECGCMMNMAAEALKRIEELEK